MSQEFLITIIFLLVGFGALIFILRKWLSDFLQKQKPSDELLEWLKATNERLDRQNKNFIGTLAKNTKSLNERLDKAAHVIGKVQKNIGEMSEIGRGMKELQEFLSSPKLRGNIGEQVLKELLTQILPKQSFHLQYKFKSGNIVDAAIETSSGIVPIDSKFPMENFQKMASAKNKDDRKNLKRQFINDVRKHIRDIASKYILTGEGTIDYALMYIPSEAVYYEIVNSPNLFDYAGEKRILPVSPTTFYAFIKAILMSFEGQKIEKQAKEILLSLKAIQKDYQNLEGSLGILGGHIKNASNMMGNVFSLTSKLGQRIDLTRHLEKQEIKELS